jgi:hypothetical protein
VKLSWAGNSTLGFPDPDFRLRAHFEGSAASRIKFYAAYVE